MSLNRLTWAIGALILAHPIASADDPPATRAPEVARLKAHVQTLASPEFAGRRGPGARKAAAYVEERLKEAGLAPLFGDSFGQPIVRSATGETIGRNIGGRIDGSDPALKDQWVVVAAHYDHLGRRGGVLYPGADDDASGTAAVLEIARVLSDPARRPRRGVLIVAFDLEEDGLVGSRYFVENPPVPMGSIRLIVDFDMIGRSLLGVFDEHVFLLGTERFPIARDWLAEAPPDPGLKVATVGADILVVDRSDYGPFRQAKVPFLFFSTGENPDYHRPSDVPETILYEKMGSIARLATALVRRGVDADTLPGWAELPTFPPSEPTFLRDIFRVILDRRESLHVPFGSVVLMRNSLKSLDEIIRRGSATPAERASFLRVAQIVLFSIT